MLEQVRRDLLADRGDNLLPARRRGQEFRPVGVVEVATWMSTAGRDCGLMTTVTLLFPSRMMRVRGVGPARAMG